MSRRHPNGIAPTGWVTISSAARSLDVDVELLSQLVNTEVVQSETFNGHKCLPADAVADLRRKMAAVEEPRLVRAILAFCGRPHVLCRVHGVATVLWLALGIAVVAVPPLSFLQRSIAFLVFVSIYANVMGHWSSWQSARVEVRQDDAP